jgi:hypothetical protein
MLHFKIKGEPIVGFVAENAGPGERVKICIKNPLVTSDDPSFNVLLTGITKIFLNKTGCPSDIICRFLIVLHQDDFADIYINDFLEASQVKVKRKVEKGERVYLKDIEDITGVMFPGIDIRTTDAVVYCTKVGWKFGLYFNFERKLDLEQLSRELGKLNKELRFEKFRDTTNAELDIAAKMGDIDALITTEGKTDWKHLKKAKERLKNKLRISFNEFEDDYGDTDILKMCMYYSRTPQETKMIFIFDRDNPKIIKKLNDKTPNTLNYQIWGNNVYSFYLPVPSHRKKYKNVCIEFFYKDEELKTGDEKGRRLYFDNELEKRISPERVHRMVKIPPVERMEYKKKIMDKDVDKIVDQNGREIAISKTVFSEYVFNDKKGFDNFNFSEFNHIFKIIEDIVSNTKTS